MIWYLVLVSFVQAKVIKTIENKSLSLLNTLYLLINSLKPPEFIKNFQSLKFKFY